jgi:hypothetical protein
MAPGQQCQRHRASHSAGRPKYNDLQNRLPMPRSAEQEDSRVSNSCKLAPGLRRIRHKAIPNDRSMSCVECPARLMIEACKCQNIPALGRHRVAASFSPMSDFVDGRRPALYCFTISPVSLGICVANNGFISAPVGAGILSSRAPGGRGPCTNFSRPFISSD